ncbi:hypothetical protein P3L10_016252 [Capsicum annuum]
MPISNVVGFADIWKANAPNKVKTFLCLLTHGKLPSNSYLSRIGLNIDPLCSYCYSSPETVNRIFFRCPNAVNFWRDLQLQATSTFLISLPDLNHTNWIRTWKQVQNLPFNEYTTCGTLIPQCLWAIWKIRNQNQFNQSLERIPTDLPINLALEMDLIISKETTHKNQSIQLSLKWEPPPVNTFKLNTDGLCSSSVGKADIGGIIRDHAGNWVIVFYEAIPQASPIQAEILAL